MLAPKSKKKEDIAENNSNDADHDFSKSIRFMFLLFLMMLSLLLLGPIYKSLVIVKFGKVETGAVEKMTSQAYFSEGMGNKECFTYIEGYKKPIKDCFFQEGIKEGEIIKYYIANKDTDYALKFTPDKSFWGVFSINSSVFTKVIIAFYLLAFFLTYLATIFTKFFMLQYELSNLKEDFKVLFGGFFKHLYSFILFICGILSAYFLFFSLTNYLVDRYANSSIALNIFVYLTFIIFCFLYPYIFNKTINFIVFSKKRILEKIAKTGSLYVLINLLIALIVSVIDNKDVNIFEIIINFYIGIFGF